MMNSVETDQKYLGGQISAYCNGSTFPIHQRGKELCQPPQAFPSNFPFSVLELEGRKGGVARKNFRRCKAGEMAGTAGKPSKRSLLSLANYLQRADTTWEPQLAI